MRSFEIERGETLRSALDFRARVLEAATFSIAAIDSEGKIIPANRAAAEVCGSEVEEVIGRSIYSCIAPNDVVKVAELIRIALDHGLFVSNAQAVKRRCSAEAVGVISQWY